MVAVPVDCAHFNITSVVVTRCVNGWREKDAAAAWATPAAPTTRTNARAFMCGCHDGARAASIGDFRTRCPLLTALDADAMNEHANVAARRARRLLRFLDGGRPGSGGRRK